MRFPLHRYLCIKKILNIHIHNFILSRFKLVNFQKLIIPVTYFWKKTFVTHGQIVTQQASLGNFLEG